MILAAFKCQMTEVEPGWGVRPDGTIYSNCKQVLQDRVNQLVKNSEGHHDYVTAGSITLVEVTQELFDKIEKKGIYSTQRNDDPGEIK